MDDTSVAALRTARGDVAGEIAYMAAQFMFVSVKRQRNEALRTTCLPTAVFAQCRRCASAAVMEYKCLLACNIIFFDLT